MPVGCRVDSLSKGEAPQGWVDGAGMVPPPLSPCPPRGSSAAVVGPFEWVQLPSPAELQGTVAAMGSDWRTVCVVAGGNGDGCERGRPSLCVAVSLEGVTGT